MRLRVVAVANGRSGYEQFERVVLCIERPALQFLLQLAHALLTVTFETKRGGRKSDWISCVVSEEASMKLRSSPVEA